MTSKPKIRKLSKTSKDLIDDFDVDAQFWACACDHGRVGTYYDNALDNYEDSKKSLEARVLSLESQLAKYRKRK